MKRKDFIRSLALAGLAPAAFYCNSPRKRKPYSLAGPDSKTGHRLRYLKPPRTGEIEFYETVIVGAGISGLTAAYTLSKNGIHQYLLLELEKITGGNSAYHQNAVSKYPLGAHYLPVPNLNQPALLDFLHDAGIITGYNAEKKPVYREEYLCQEPEERLFIKNNWQEGLVPDYSVPEADKKQIAAFLQRMQQYRGAMGDDGKEAFCIPVMHSSRDPEFLYLDTISFKTFLERNNWHSEYLHWYADYCLRDDFGTRYEDTSAWMGIHYFASRKGISANADANDVLTWPEGNGKLADSLMEKITGTLLRQKMAVHIEFAEKKHNRVLLYDTDKDEYRTIGCRNLILAIPQFICRKILPETSAHPLRTPLQYSPWLVANLTVKPFEENPRGRPLSWDNVIYGSSGLGYVNACHQNLQTIHEKYVLTYYKPLLEKPPAEMRKAIRGNTATDWKKLVLDDLGPAHPDLDECLTDAEFYTTGHSMPQPRPGIVKEVLAQEMESDIPGLYFCHSDRSGYSIFEEAFYWGHHVAQQIIRQQQE